MLKTGSLVQVQLEEVVNAPLSESGGQLQTLRNDGHGPRSLRRFVPNQHKSATNNLDSDHHSEWRDGKAGVRLLIKSARRQPLSWNKPKTNAIARESIHLCRR